MNRAVLWAAMAGASIVAACAGGPAVSGDATGTSTDAGATPPGNGADSGLPCDVAQVLSSKCGSCHGAGGAQAPTLASYTDLTTGNVSDRVLARMQDTANPMPPVYAGVPASAADVAIVQAWVSAGEPAGACGAIDAGPPAPAPTTCASGNTWTLGNRGSSDMNPGKACITCHTSEGEASTRYMGTAFPALHERDLCNARPPLGATVEILDAAGAVAETLVISPTSGNFASLRIGPPGSYRARVMVNGAKVSEMMGLQTNGDCNSCHTEQGAQGAPGRIVY
jgi:hypothetical protein